MSETHFVEWPNTAKGSTAAVITGYDVEGQPVYRSASGPVPRSAEQSQNGNSPTQDGNVSRETIGRINFSPSREALSVIEDRQDDYGDPDPIYRAVGRKWGAHLSLLFGIELPDIPEKHVYLMLADMKGTREASKEKTDNLTDKVGYTELAARARR